MATGYGIAYKGTVTLSQLRKHLTEKHRLSSLWAQTLSRWADSGFDRSGTGLSRAREWCPSYDGFNPLRG